MLRIDALKAIYPQLETASSSRSWARSPRNCKSSGTGPTSSICSTRWGSPPRWASGSPCRRPELPVVVLDGDGSILMNLGSLTTMARYRPQNLMHIVFDNESLLSVGGFPTATVDRQRYRRHGEVGRRARTHVTVHTLDSVHGRPRQRPAPPTN